MRGLQNFGFVIGMIMIGFTIFMAIINKISKNASEEIMRNKITYNVIMTLTYIGIGILTLCWAHSCIEGRMDW